MNAFLAALHSHGFLQHALLGGILASIACGIVGSYVVVKRIGYLAGGVAHAILGGMGIAYFLGRSPFAGALAAALLSAIIIGWVSLRLKQQEDTVIGALWAMGMALGVLFISRTPGYNTDLMSYLFGSILMISRHDLYLMAGLDVLIATMAFLLHKQLLAVAFDEEFARLCGVRVEPVYMLLLCLVALTVVILVQVVGLILVIALLTLPAAIARQYVSSLGRMMLLASLLSIAFAASGLALSYEPDLPAGSVIILLASGVYLASTAATSLGRRNGARARMMEKGK